MAIDRRVLEKNEAFVLSDDLAQVVTSVGVASRDGSGLDWDLSAIFLGSDGKMWAENSLVFWNQPDDSPLGAVRRVGDARPDGNEEIVVDLPRVDARTYMILLTVTSFSEEGTEDLGRARGVAVSLLDSRTGEECCRYVVKKDMSGHRSVSVAALRRKGLAWEFVGLAECIGKSAIGLEDVLNHYRPSIGEGS